MNYIILNGEHIDMEDVCHIHTDAGELSVGYMDKNGVYRSVKVSPCPKDFKLVVTGCEYKEPWFDRISDIKIGNATDKPRAYAVKPNTGGVIDAFPNVDIDHSWNIPEPSGFWKMAEVVDKAIDNIMDEDVEEPEITCSYRCLGLVCPDCGCNLIDLRCTRHSSTRTCHDCGRAISFEGDTNGA